MKSLRRQLARELVIVHVLLVGLGLVAIIILIWQALVGSFDSTIRTRALAITALTEIEDGRVQFDFSDAFLHGFSVEHPRSYFEVWDSAGAVLVRSPSLPGIDLPLAAEGTPEHPQYWNFTLPNGRPARAISFTFVPAPSDVPQKPPTTSVRLIVAVDRDALNETIEGMIAVVLGCGGFLFLAVFLIVPRVLRRGLKSLDRLGDEVALIDANSLARRFPTAELPAELRLIGEKLNELLARLETTFERERRFNADIAHELRTPISELRSLAECALKWPDSRDEAADRDILAIALQMEGLVTSMLTLARADEGELKANLAPVEILPLAVQVWRLFEVRAAEQRLGTTFTVSADTVQADPVLINSILANLFDNVVTYTPAGDEVQITGRLMAGRYILQVANPAPDLRPTDLPHLFERLWRKDYARSGGKHFGLGLSLAADFAAVMNWRLSAELNDEGWLVLTLAQNASTDKTSR